MKNFILFTILIAFITIGDQIAFATGKSQDNVPGNECLHGEHVYNPHCQPTLIPTNIVVESTALPTKEITPTIEVAPTCEATPSATEGVTPSAMPTVTPIISETRPTGEVTQSAQPTVTLAPTPTPAIATPQGAPVASLRER